MTRTTRTSCFATRSALGSTIRLPSSASASSYPRERVAGQPHLLPISTLRKLLCKEDSSLPELQPNVNELGSCWPSVAASKAWQQPLPASQYICFIIN
ncbi:hypothetical protein BC831DRAFT_459166, partial [Entophlyctis helioformis]